MKAPQDHARRPRRCPNRSTTQDAEHRGRDRRPVDRALPGGRLVEPLGAALARDLLRVLARSAGGRCGPRARSSRRACRGACACACAWSGPSDRATLPDGPAAALFEDVPLRVEAAQRHVRPGSPRRPRAGASPISSASATSARSRTHSTMSRKRHRAVVVHVRRDLRPAAVGQVEADRAHAGQAAAGLAQRRRRSFFASSTSSVTRSTLNATSGGRAVGEHGAGRRMRLRRAVVRHELARLDPRAPAPSGRRAGSTRARRARAAWRAPRRGTPARRPRRRSAPPR